MTEFQRYKREIGGPNSSWTNSNNSHISVVIDER